MSTTRFFLFNIAAFSLFNILSISDAKAISYVLNSTLISSAGGQCVAGGTQLGTAVGTVDIPVTTIPPFPTNPYTGQLNYTNTAGSGCNATAPTTSYTANVYFNAARTVIIFVSTTNTAQNLQFQLAAPIDPASPVEILDRNANSASILNCTINPDPLPSGAAPAVTDFCTGGVGSKFTFTANSVFEPVPNPLSALAFAPILGLLSLRKRYAQKPPIS